MKRRRFLKKGSQVSLGFIGLQSLLVTCASKSTNELLQDGLLSEGYGPLLDDPKGVLNLPEGFSYDIISRQGEKMNDGFLVPGQPDGMATFAGPDGKVLIIRNHEVSAGDLFKGAFGENMELLPKNPNDHLYDFGRGEEPCMGGTTTIVYNPNTGKVENQYLSLAGTIRNCAGGPTPWNSWITCEEDVSKSSKTLEQNHGYNFEVPAKAEPFLAEPKPIKAMGRFMHEAVAVDPKTGIVYQTEDRHDSLIYRFIPEVYGDLHQGGKLQMLAIKDEKSFSTRNWKRERNTMERNRKYEVTWMDVEDIDSPKDDLRTRGFKQGAARFARGEGMWFGEGEVFFACTSGGRSQYGQIFRYIPSPQEGEAGESDQPGTLELFIESENADILMSCDNLTVGSNGDLVICEDRPTPRIIGISQKGDIYHIAKNVGYRSEFAGATFSPDGQVLFVNIQNAGLTIAIKGPWGQRKIG